jgi:RHS repeat-associated protein
MNAAMPEPADFQVNQYTATPFDSREYDFNGNLTDRTGLAGMVYDYRNQMVEYALTAGERHTYSYDVLGRRITKVTDTDGIGSGPTATHYLYHGWQVIEEQGNAGATEATYVYGLYIDEVLHMRRGDNEFFYHTDDLYNVMALTDAAGIAVERYEFADYGQPIDPVTLVPVPGDPSAVGNPWLFTGRRYDLETEWYYYRTRNLDPIAGRFTTRDIIGIWGDVGNFGNGYAYVSNNPATSLDPLGLGDPDSPGNGDPSLNRCPRTCMVCLLARPPTGLDIIGDRHSELWIEDCNGERTRIWGDVSKGPDGGGLKVHIPKGNDKRSRLVAWVVPNTEVEWEGTRFRKCVWVPCDVCDCLRKKAKSVSGVYSYGAFCVGNDANCNSITGYLVTRCKVPGLYSLIPFGSGEIKNHMTWGEVLDDFKMD